MNRRAFITGLLSCAALAACGREPPRLPALPPDAVVLAFGDSVTYGTGASKGEDWPSLLAGMTGWEIVNAGIPGDTAQAGVGRLPALLEDVAPALVIIEIGGNDFLRRRSSAAVKEDLRQMLRSVKAAGAQAVLVAVPELSLLGAVAGRASDAALYAELAKEEGVPLVEDVFSDILSRPELCADKIHPNAAGYHVMATGIHHRLRAVGLAL